MRITTLLQLGMLTALAACSRAPGDLAEAAPSVVERPLPTPVLTPQQSGTTALLQAVSVVSDRVVWVSGHAGTFARTLDGGATWTSGRVAGADTLQFRDVHAASADTAWLMSAGNGQLSRIFRTTDGGRSWTQQYLNREPDAFFDCMAFWDARRGVVFSDAVRGEHFVLTTANGGEHWERVPPSDLPPAMTGQGGFAASGTCITTLSRNSAIICAGNAPRSEVLKTTDAGRTWVAYPVPVVAGDAAGIASVAFRDSVHGVAVGGEIGKPQARGDYVALTSDGGQSWTLGGRFTFAGAAYGAAYVPLRSGSSVVAVGPGGADLSTDDGRTWVNIDTLQYWSIGFASPSSGWAVGPRGRITHIRLY